MNKRTWAAVIVTVFIAALVINFPLTQAKAGSCCPSNDKTGEMEMKGCTKTTGLSLDKIQSRNLPALTETIDKAIKSIHAGNNKQALLDLIEAKKMLSSINEAFDRHFKPEFANALCPITGSAINPDKVAKNVTRDYKDQKIAFCCGGCCTTWDQLTDAEKDAKLAKIKPKPVESHSGHKH